MSRVTAWAALRSGDGMGMRAIDRLAYRRGLDARDTALARKLVGTEARRRGTLRAVAKHFLDRKAKADLSAHLHLGIAQVLFFDRIPPHAAVSETLGAVHETMGPSKVPKVNAILRNVLRALKDGHSGDPRCDLVGRDLHFDRPIFHDPEEHPLLWAEDALSMPAQVMKRWVKRLGADRARELAELALGEPPLFLRVLRGDVESAVGELQAAGLDPQVLPDSRSIRLAGDATATALGLEGFQQGRWIVQGAWASSVADAVAAQPGERVLDLCAAPGGKTAVLAATGAQVTSLDLSAARLRRLVANAERLGLDVRAIACEGVRGLKASERFDAILIDAPCSNTGVLSARPEARWRFGPKSLGSLVDVQTELLEAALPHLAPGGRLVWSTCSLEPEENERLVQKVLAGKSGLFVEESRTGIPALDGMHDGGSWTTLRAESEPESTLKPA